MTKMCAQMACPGKRSGVAYEGTSLGFEEVPQVPATFKIKMIINTELYLVQNTRVFLSCWIFWHFPRTPPVKIRPMNFYLHSHFLPQRHPSMTMLPFKIRVENDLRNRKQKVLLYSDYFKSCWEHKDLFQTLI